MSKDGFEKEIESWNGFLSGLRKPDYDLFKKMLEGTREYKDVIKSKDGAPTEVLLMVLVLQQQKIIHELFERHMKKEN